MKKERFKEIVNDYTSTSDDINSLKKLASDYPFSQIVHLLLANAAKKNDLKVYKPSLNNAAFHSTDRSILKSLIEHNLVPSEEILNHPAPTVKKAEEIKEKRTSPPSIPAKKAPIDSDKLIAEVLKNLEKLQVLKKEATLWLDENSKSKLKKPSTSQKKAAPKNHLSKKQPKLKKQSNLIEKFIKEEPSITKNAPSVNDKQDMAKESSEMREDIISESLAKIFVKQKKNEKAIDIYKKLIWKFPQKKALFAAQIEKLKKK